MIIKVKKISIYFRIFDYLLAPFMWFFSGLKFELPQETHWWHIQNFQCKDASGVLNVGQTAEVKGDDSSRFEYDSFGLLHLPVFGGWKRYVILEAEGFQQYWHVGWIARQNGSEKPGKCQVQKLHIYSRQIKLLKGVSGYTVKLFGLNEKGEQIPVKIIAEGQLGDGKFRSIRLF